MRRLLALAVLVMSKPPKDLDDEKDLKLDIPESEINIPKDIAKSNSHYEGEEYVFYCPQTTDQAITNVYYQIENSMEGYLSKKRVLQKWGQTTEGAQDYRGRVSTREDTGFNMRVILTKTTLKDSGFYFCEILERGEDVQFTQLNELIMWAKPTSPQITSSKFYYSNQVKSDEGENVIDYAKPQSVLKCSSHEGFPAPKLRWLDQNGRVVASKTECFPNSVRQEVLDCTSILTMVVTKELDMTTWTCAMEHEALRGQVLNEVRQIEVHYPPTEVGIRGNRTAKTVTCSARSKPPSKFKIKIGKGGTSVPIGREDGSYYIEDFTSLPANDVIYCYADNGVKPDGVIYEVIETLFDDGFMMSSIHWILIAAVGGALLIVLIILCCCCCRKKKEKFENSSKSKSSNQYHRGQSGNPKDNTMASNVSYNYRKPDGQTDPKDTVEDYLRRAQSKERLVEEYENSSSHPTEYHDQLQRTRELISRSRENLDHIEEIEVTNRDLRPREDSFEDSFGQQYDPPSYNEQPQYAFDYGDDDRHLYQNDPAFKPTQHNNHYRS